MRLCVRLLSLVLVGGTRVRRWLQERRCRWNKGQLTSNKSKLDHADSLKTVVSISWRLLYSGKLNSEVNDDSWLKKERPLSRAQRKEIVKSSMLHLGMQSPLGAGALSLPTAPATAWPILSVAQERAKLQSFESFILDRLRSFQASLEDVGPRTVSLSKKTNIDDISQHSPLSMWTKFTFGNDSSNDRSRCEWSTSGRKGKNHIFFVVGLGSLRYLSYLSSCPLQVSSTSLRLSLSYLRRETQPVEILTHSCLYGCPRGPISFTTARWGRGWRSRTPGKQNWLFLSMIFMLNQYA